MGAAMIQRDCACFVDWQVLRPVGSNPGHRQRAGRAFTWGNGSQMPKSSPSLGGTVLAVLKYGKQEKKKLMSM